MRVSSPLPLMNAEPLTAAEPACGDGELSDGERCDEGNTDPHDGCSANCQAEAGWGCDETSECSSVLCAQNQRVVNNACEACPEGSTNAGGDAADGADTLCQDACTEVLGVHCSEFEQGYLKASNTGREDAFGSSVSLSGDTLAVGVRREDSSTNLRYSPRSANVTGPYAVFEPDDAAIDSGAVYVFVRSGETWEQEAFLKAADAAEGDGFGTSVSLHGDRLAVGAPSKDESTEIQGSAAVYMFMKHGYVWEQRQQLTAAFPATNDLFGWSVSLHGDTLAVGVVGDEGAFSGVADQRGVASPSPSLSPDESPARLDDSGAVYVFTVDGERWEPQSYIKASDLEAFDRFGSSVSLFGNTLAVGAPIASGIRGAAYVFARAGDTWTEQAIVEASNSRSLDNFGASVSLFEDTLAVAAPSSGRLFGSGIDAFGVVYVFARDENTWTQQALINDPNLSLADGFGTSISLFGNTLAVGARSESSGRMGANSVRVGEEQLAFSSGGTYLFTRLDGGWSQQALVKASNAERGDGFGSSVSLSGNTLAVGAVGEASAATGVNGDQGNNEAPRSGAVYIRRIAP